METKSLETGGIGCNFCFCACHVIYKYYHVPESQSVVSISLQYRFENNYLAQYYIGLKSVVRGKFNGQLLVQWPTRPLGDWDTTCKQVIVTVKVNVN